MRLAAWILTLLERVYGTNSLGVGSKRGRGVGAFGGVDSALTADPRRLSCARMAYSFRYIRAGHIRSASSGHIRAVDSQAPESPAAGPLWQDASDGVFNVMHSPGSDVAGRLLLLGL